MKSIVGTSICLFDNVVMFSKDHGCFGAVLRLREETRAPMHCLRSSRDTASDSWVIMGGSSS